VWRSVPAIQRAIGESPLTAGTPEFVDSLAGSHDPDLSLEILGHHVSMDAPHGLVSGIARPIETYAPSTEMVGRPRKREAATPVARAIEAPEPSERGRPLEGVESPDEPLPASPLRPLTAVDAATLTLAAKPLTRLADADRATVAAQVAPVQRAREATPASAQAAAQTPGAPPAPQPTVQRLTLGQSRRLGLGAPLVASRRDEVVRTSTDPPLLDLASAPSQVRSAEPEAHGPVISPGPPEASALPGARSLQRRSTSGDVDDIGSERADNVEGTPVTDPGSNSPEIDHPPVALHIAGVSIPHAPAVQRVIARTLPPLYAPPPGIRSPTVPLTPSRQPVPAGRAALELARQPGPVVQAMRTTQSSLDQAVVPSVWSIALSGTSGRESAPEPSPFAPSPPHLRLAMPAMPVAQRMPARPDGAAAAAGGFDGSAPAVSEFAVAAYEPVLQREIAPGESPAPAVPTAGAAPSESAAAGPTAGATPPTQSEHELDELARKLYEPLSARFRRDLLVERERAGMVTDLR
jgi:hypothetical protein